MPPPCFFQPCRLLLLATMAGGLPACNTLPQRPAAPVSQALPPPPLLRAPVDTVFPLVDPLEAFAVRVQMIRSARHSIDLA